MTIIIPSENIQEAPKTSLILKNKINSIEYTNHNLVKNTGGFGDSKSVVLELYETKNGTTTYTEVYNNSEHNPFYNSTEIVTLETNGVTFEYYKTRIEFDIGSFILEDPYSLKVNINATTKPIASNIGVGIGSYSTVQSMNGAINAIRTQFDVLNGIVGNKLYLDVLVEKKWVSGSTFSSASRPINYTVQLYGDYYTTKNETIVTSGTSSDFTLETNELFQSQLGSDLSTKIIEAYKDGKQTATVLCSMSDYYEDITKQKKAISVNTPNILNSDNYKALWNATYNIETGTINQINADTKTEYSFQLQKYMGDEYLGELEIKTITQSQRISLTFTKDDSFDTIRFKLNGGIEDTGVTYDASFLENRKAYCFSANVNIDGGQGNIYWNEMQINYGVRALPYNKGNLPMTFKQYDKVLVMIMAYNGIDYPLTNAKGEAQVFEVLGVEIFYDGEVLQKLSLQEC